MKNKFEDRSSDDPGFSIFWLIPVVLLLTVAIFLMLNDNGSTEGVDPFMLNVPVTVPSFTITEDAASANATATANNIWTYVGQ